MPQVIKKVTKRKGSAPVTQTVIVNVSKGRRGARAVPKAKAQGQPASMNVGQSVGSEYAQLTGIPYLGHVAGRYPGMMGGFNQPLHIVSEKEALEKQLVELKKIHSLEQKPLMAEMGIQQKPLMVDSSVQVKPLIEVIRDMPSTKSISIGTDMKGILEDSRPFGSMMQRQSPKGSGLVPIPFLPSLVQKPLVMEMGVQSKPLMVEMGIQEKPLMVDMGIQVKPKPPVTQSSTQSSSSLSPKPPVTQSSTQSINGVNAVAESLVPAVASLPAIASLPAVVREVMPQQDANYIEGILRKLEDIPKQIKGRLVNNKPHKDLITLVREVNRNQTGNNKFVRQYGKIENGTKDNFKEYLRQFPADTAREYNNMGY